MSLKDIVEFAINIDKENNKLSLKKNAKLYCCRNIVLAILNRINRNIDIKTKTNYLNILTCLINSSNSSSKRKRKK